jgi:LacI family transcriptional regulator
MNIDEIARKAGVSRATVSRVLNNHPSVKEKTRQTIRQIIESIDYIPNAAARSLASKRNDVIGVLVYNITQPFWAGIYAGIEQYISQNTSYGILLANSKGNIRLRSYTKDHKRYLKTLIQKGVDGLIIALENDLQPDDIDFLVASGIPFVIIQNHMKDERITSVNVDNYDGAYQATKYLLKQGHANILHAAGPLDGSIARDRMEGFVKAMQDEGIPLTESNVIPCGFMFEDGYWCMKRLLSRAPEFTAILFANDAAAFGGYLAAKEAGIAIPDDLSIAGFDHLTNEMDLAGLLPDLTTMAQPVSELGKIAAELLYKKLSDTEYVQSVTYPMTLYKGRTVKEQSQQLSC